MNNQEKVKISANSNIGFLGSILVLIIVFPIFSMFTDGSSIKMALLGLAFFLLLAILAYLLIYTCDAWIDGERIVLKKKFRQEKSYSFDKIEKLKAIQLKRDKYTTVNMKNDDGTTEKYIIMNKKSLLPSDNDKDAEQILRSLLN